MNIETTTATVRRLTASEGHLLIDRDTLAAARAERPATPPYAAPVVYLGSGDTPARFVEIPADDPVLMPAEEVDQSAITQPDTPIQ